MFPQHSGMAPNKPSIVIDEREAAGYIGLTAAYLRKARQRNRGPAFLRIGRTIRYRTVDLDAWLAKHRKETTESRAS